tara:strand:+ start:244 stop:576 length:333 start_codon:yes stop_codon:yes gene_type:complete
MANGTYDNPRAGSNGSKNRMKEMTDKVNIRPAYTGLEKLNKGDSHDYHFDKAGHTETVNTFGGEMTVTNPSTQTWINRIGKDNQKAREDKYLKQAAASTQTKTPQKKKKK